MFLVRAIARAPLHSCRLSLYRSFAWTRYPDRERTRLRSRPDPRKRTPAQNPKETAQPLDGTPISNAEPSEVWQEASERSVRNAVGGLRHLLQNNHLVITRCVLTHT